MKILKTYPPNFEELNKKFELNEFTVFTYGDKLYNPNNVAISEDLIAHEETHVKQQGKDPKKWWRKYIDDKNFRLSQETEAYSNQYKAFKEMKKDRNERARFLHFISCELSSSLYGNIIDYQEAKERIENFVL